MNNVQKLIVCKGLQGSGKSTFAKQYVKDNPNTIRVCRDDIREMLTPMFKHGSRMEELVTFIEDNAIEEALKNKYSVIIDACNLRNPWKWHHYSLANNHIDYEIKEFSTSLEECIERDSKREKPVGKEVIINTYNRYYAKQT